MRLAERGLKVLVLEPGGLNASPTASPGWLARIARKLRGTRTVDPNAWRDTVTRYEHFRAGRKRRIWPVLGQGPGGSSALYDGALGRFRREDLDRQPGDPLNGTAPLPDGWPISFDELRGYYRAAEAVMRVVGERDPLDDEDDSDPSRPPPLSKRDATIMGDLERAGMHPYRLRVGIDYMPGCDECLGRRCPRLCKADGYSRALLRGLATGRVGVELGTTVSEIVPMGTMWQVIGCGDDATVREHLGRIVIVAAGALNTPLVLDRSERLWRGRARPELIGRGLMFHLSDIFLVTPRRKPRPGDATGPVKTIAFRDLYSGEQGIGEVQSYGAVLTTGLIMAALRALLNDVGFPRYGRVAELARPFAWAASRAVNPGAVFATIQPDPPFAANRVWEEVEPAGTPPEPGRRPRVAFTYRVSPELRARSRRMRWRLVAAFAPNRVVFLSLRAGTPNLGHPMGTCRMGSNPEHSVVDPQGQVWGHPGLYVGDASVFPSSGGAGPSLTVAALGLRLGDHVASVLERQDRSSALPPSGPSRTPRVRSRPRDGQAVAETERLRDDG
jgi:choline dehydrogenase-like flavoprotein